jgi:hypothetical protein
MPDLDAITRGVTAAEIDAGMTKKGGWTYDQLREWGVPCPPPKGWRQRLIANAAKDAEDARVDDALCAAHLAIDEYYNGDRVWASKWLVAAYEANKGTK